ncbi:arabinogalactan O-methyltransferase 2-like [Silene latifolia]|uniref:arabinogalactan O-methyltransferase 2-like n=1 Tax=Silene latifolia TaxID=37657 RepID=UPI003D779A1D
MRSHTRYNNIFSNIKHNPSNARLLVATLLSFVAGALLMFVVTNNNLSVSTTTATTTIQQEAILHYATSEIVPQQSLQEIMQSFNVLRTTAPCNFLVFGLGYDSLMWAALNPNGTTLFLEESDEWVTSILKDAPFLKAKTVSYRTHLKNANWLRETYRDNPDCQPSKGLKGNTGCPLALESLPDEVYEREWDVIMIDAPRGWEPDHPGRMAAIYSMAVMARARTRPGNTHVYLHDVNRQVEKTFGMEFLCEKYKVGGVGRLWHFEIPPVRDNVGHDATFC